MLLRPGCPADRRQIGYLIRLAQRRISLQDISHDNLGEHTGGCRHCGYLLHHPATLAAACGCNATGPCLCHFLPQTSSPTMLLINSIQQPPPLAYAGAIAPLPAAEIVPFNLVVYLGPAGTLTVWTVILLATYAGFIHAMWQLLAWSAPTLALGPWEVALCLGSLAKQAWGWVPTLCWAAPIFYSFDAVCQLGVKVAALQDRVHAAEGRETQLMGKLQALEGKVTTLEDRVMYLEGRLEVAGKPRLVCLAPPACPSAVGTCCTSKKHPPWPTCSTEQAGLVPSSRLPASAPAWQPLPCSCACRSCHQTLQAAGRLLALCIVSI